jgi:hypothetical protein
MAGVTLDAAIASARRENGTVASRTRIGAFGSVAVLVVTGAMCAVLVGGLTGQVLAIALISTGLGAALLLVFLEVGLSEDRERAGDEERRGRRAQQHVDAQRRPPLRRGPRRRG